MSIQSEINRISGNVADAYAAVEEKGGALPEQQTSANLAQAVRGVPTGITEAELSAALTAKQDKLTGAQGQVVGFDAQGNAVAQDAPESGTTHGNGLTFLKQQYRTMADVSGAYAGGTNFYVYREGEHGIVVFYNAANIFSSKLVTAPDTGIKMYKSVDLSNFVNLVPESDPLMQIDVCLSGQNSYENVVSYFDLATGEFYIAVMSNKQNMPLTLPGFARFESDQITFKEATS